MTFHSANTNKESLHSYGEKKNRFIFFPSLVYILVSYEMRAAKGMGKDPTGLESVSVPQQFRNKARLCSPSWSVVLKGSLEIQKSVKQLRNAITFHKSGPKRDTQRFNSSGSHVGTFPIQKWKRQAQQLSSKYWLYLNL